MKRILLVVLLVCITAVAAGCSTQGMPSTDTNPPSGAPPTGNAPTSSNSSPAITGVYAQSSGTQTTSGQTYKAESNDQSAVYVTKTGVLTLNGATVTTSGDTSSQDNSSFYGLNAAVLAADGGTVSMDDGTIATTGLGANGAFATGAGSTVALTGTNITATGDGGHAVMATAGGSMTVRDVSMTTTGKNAGAIATDRGGGTITATGCAVTTSGQDSPAIYSTGTIAVADSTLLATGAEAAVIEGANSITVTNCSLSSRKEDKWGVMIYQSMSGDAEGARGVFTMTGGSLTYGSSTGSLFYVTNTTAVITLDHVTLTTASGRLVEAGAGRWGASGSNGGTVLLTANAQALTGDVSADALSSVTLTLTNESTLTGAINAAGTAKSAVLALDATSSWIVTADSALTGLSGCAVSGSTITNIVGNGHTVTYDPAASPSLGGRTYTLSGGGTLKPAA